MKKFFYKLMVLAVLGMMFGIGGCAMTKNVAKGNGRPGMATAKPACTEINSVEVKLTGKRLEIKTLDLSTIEGLSEVIQWGHDMYFEGRSAENSPTSTFPKMLRGNSLYTPKTRLFKQAGDKITYIDVPGHLYVSNTCLLINGQEYLLAGEMVVGRGVGVFYNRRLVNLGTGEMAAKDMLFSGILDIVVSPDKKLYFISRETTLDEFGGDFQRIASVYTVFSADGAEMGNLIGPREVRFLDNETVGGITEQHANNYSCSYQDTLNLKTQQTSSKQLSCKEIKMTDNFR